MKSLEEVIKYKFNFLPKRTDPFHAIQKFKVEIGIRASFYKLYETKNAIFSNDSFTLVEDLTPLFIYISSCDKYYRENDHGKILDISITLYIGYKSLMFGCYLNTYDDEYNDLGEYRIAMIKKRLIESISIKGYCERYIEPFKIEITVGFVSFPKSTNNYKTFKSDQCAICLEEKPKVLFCKCGHICICKKCTSHRHDNCPVCKEENTILRIIE